MVGLQNDSATTVGQVQVIPAQPFSGRSGISVCLTDHGKIYLVTLLYYSQQKGAPETKSLSI